MSKMAQLAVRYKKRVDELEVLVNAYREQRKYDGVDCRKWDAQKYHAADLVVKKLEGVLNDT